ncbi:hypothetical protein [Thioclava marina]|uniref:hypothetical protein n=1 Tax=Thioclava marina TaxID=1915077 RepID=UPI0023533E7C|nr:MULTISPECIES: hypothetical protein [Thioclava]
MSSASRFTSFLKLIEGPQTLGKGPKFWSGFGVVLLAACAYPQMLCELPGLHSGDAILETTVGELNIAGIPGITVPAGYYASGAPFELIFLGKQWTEHLLIQCAYAYEQGTLHRKPAI